MTNPLKQHRMRVLSVLSLITYLYIVVTIVGTNLEDFKIGYETGYNNAQDISNASQVYYLTLEAKGNILDFPNTLNNTHRNEAISYRPYQIKAMGPRRQEQSTAMKIQDIVSGIVSFAVLGILIYLPLAIRKLLVNFRYHHFFHESNVKRLRRLGLLLLSTFLMLLITNTLYHHTLTFLFDFKDYNIIQESPNFAWLICGLLFMIFSEALKQGIALKEEHDLTV